MPLKHFKNPLMDMLLGDALNGKPFFDTKIFGGETEKPHEFISDNEIFMGTKHRIYPHEILNNMSDRELAREIVTIQYPHNQGLFILISGKNDSGKSHNIILMVIDQMIRRLGIHTMFVDPKGENCNLQKLKPPNSNEFRLYDKLGLSPIFTPEFHSYRPLVCCDTIGVETQKLNTYTYTIQLEKITLNDLFTLLNLNTPDTNTDNLAKRGRLQEAVNKWYSNHKKEDKRALFNRQCPPLKELIHYIAGGRIGERDMLIETLKNLRYNNILGKFPPMPKFSKIISEVGGGFQRIEDEIGECRECKKITSLRYARKSRKICNSCYDELLMNISIPILHTTIDSDMQGTMRGVIQIAIKEVLHAKLNSELLPFPINFVIDEFNIVANKTTKDFRFYKNILDQYRSFGVGLIGVTPSAADINETLIRQCDFWITGKIAYNSDEYSEIKKRVGSAFDPRILCDLEDRGKGKYPKQMAIIDRDGNVTPFYPTVSISKKEVYIGGRGGLVVSPDTASEIQDIPPDVDLAGEEIGIEEEEDFEEDIIERTKKTKIGNLRRSRVEQLEPEDDIVSKLTNTERRIYEILPDTGRVRMSDIVSSGVIDKRVADQLLPKMLRKGVIRKEKVGLYAFYSRISSKSNSSTSPPTTS